MRAEHERHARHAESIYQTARADARLAQHGLVEARVVRGHPYVRRFEEWPERLDARGEHVRHQHEAPWRRELHERDALAARLRVPVSLRVETDQPLAAERRDRLLQLCGVGDEAPLYPAGRVVRAHLRLPR